MLSRRISYLFSILFLVLLFNACQDEQSKTLDPSLFGYEYFPLELGHTWLYQLDSTIIDDQGGTIIQSTRFLRETVSDVFVNAENKEIYVIERAIADSINGEYRVSDIWTAEKTSAAAFRVEENLRFNKLVFPLQLDVEWTGNLFDNLTEVDVAGEMMWVYKDWGDYQVVANGIDYRVNGTNYSDVAAVLQADHDFAIERRYAIEYYAPEIGLIEKQMIIYDTQCECPGESWEEKADSGFSFRQTIIEFN